MIFGVNVTAYNSLFADAQSWQTMVRLHACRCPRLESVICVKPVRTQLPSDSKHQRIFGSCRVCLQ